MIDLLKLLFGIALTVSISSLLILCGAFMFRSQLSETAMEAVVMLWISTNLVVSLCLLIGYATKDLEVTK